MANKQDSLVLSENTGQNTVQEQEQEQAQKQEQEQPENPTGNPITDTENEAVKTQEAGKNGSPEKTIKNPYSYHFEFAKDTDHVQPAVKSSIVALIIKNSQLEFLHNEPIENDFALIRRINNDIGVAEEVLKAYGFYLGKAQYHIEKQGNLSKVLITLHPHEQFTIDNIEIKYTHSTVLPEYFKTYQHKRESFFQKYVPYEQPEFIEKLQVPTKYAIAEEIMKSVDALPTPLKNNGYPNAMVASSAYSLNTEEKTLKGTVFLNQGLPATIGDVTLSGNTEVNGEYILKLRPWQVGAVWDDRYLLEYREILQKTGLFESVQIQYDRKVYRETNRKYRDDRKVQNNKDLSLEPVELPVLLEVKEAKKRSIGAEAFYSTDRGLGLQGSWEHRNILGNGEILKLSLPINDDELYLGAEFKKPAFLANEQNLIMRSRMGYEKTDAYNQKFVEYGVGIERKLYEKWWLESILMADYVIPKEWQGEEYYSLMYSNTLKYDNRDSNNNPNKGFITKFRLAPLYGLGDVTFSSLIAEFDTSVYIPLGDKTVFAVRGAVGSMLGGDDNIPRSKRFFLGGGGSVRGFEHQEIGRHDPNGDPLGGLSYVLFNSEIRQLVAKDLAVVPFVDGGMVYQDISPDFSEQLAIGAGIGVRYNTPVGPVRFDIAVPLTGEHERYDKDIFKDYQMYISIGQAF